MFEDSDKADRLSDRSGLSYCSRSASNPRRRGTLVAAVVAIEAVAVVVVVATEAVAVAVVEGSPE